MLLCALFAFALGALSFAVEASIAAPLCSPNATASDILAGQDFSGKIVVVTGGDSGLGFATALAVAQRGATVVIGNHNATHGAEAAKEIEKQTGAEVIVFPLNLGSLASVRAFVASFEKRFGSRLHLLVNNAGIVSPSKKTDDGFETVFEVDYLGHFLLTELLLPALRASKPSRVVNVASGAHENACESAGWPIDCFKDWTYLPPPVVPRRPVTVHYKTGAAVVNSSSYGIAKFLNIQHAEELAHREKDNGIKAFSLTPGFALTSMTSGFDPTSPKSKAFCEQQVHPDPSLPPNPCPFSAEQGAAVIALCASSEVVQSGAYYSRTFACEARPVVAQGFTEAMRGELYDRSRRWAGLAAPFGPTEEAVLV